MAQPEVWLRGPIAGIDPYLMPAAHALVEALEEVTAAAAGLGVEQVWARPQGAAPIGFHLRHMAGSIDRLHTYARGEVLSPAQLAAKARETQPGDPPAAAATLLTELQAAVDTALEGLRAVRFEQLLEPRAVGAQRLPANVLGLLFHAAEHARRHAGQVVTLAQVVAPGAP